MKSKKSGMNTSAAVYLILVKGGGYEILVLRRCNTRYQDGMYQVPAGKIEFGESPTQAMIREAKEEIGITLSPQDLKLVHVSCRSKHDETGNRVDFFFRARTWKGEVVNAEPGKCDDLRWVLPSKLPENTTPHVREAIHNVHRGITFAELSLEWINAQPEYGMKYLTKDLVK